MDNEQHTRSTPDRNAVLEEAAKIAEKLGRQHTAGADRTTVARNIATAIRGRKTTTPEPTDPAGVSEMADDLSLRDRLMIEIAYCRHAEIPVSEEVTRLLAIMSTRTPDPVLEVAKEALENLVASLDALIADSEGVYGLHLNGNPAPWSELTEGGRFEDWLIALEPARAALQNIKEGEAK